MSYNPYSGSNSRSSRSKGGSGYSPYPTSYGKPATTKFTAEQMLQLLKAKQAHHSESFVDRIEHAGKSGLHVASWSFDKLLRPEYAIATAVDQGIHGGVGGALHGAREGFMGRGDHGFGEVLAHHGVLSGHRRLRGLAGFALDVAADPLTYVSGGTAALVKGGEHAALIKAGRIAIGSSKVSKEEHAAMAAARDTLKGAHGYEARHALASHQTAYLAKALKAPKSIKEIDKGALATLREAAKAEEGSVERRLPHYSIGVGQHKLRITPTHIGGARVVPALPKLANVTGKPVIGHAAQKFSDLFVRSPHETAVTHALNITHTHLGEQYTDEMIKILKKHFKGVPHLSEDEMLNALHHVEATKDAVIKTKNGAFVLNIAHMNKLVRDGKITGDEEKFIRAWHKATQELYKRDKSFGLDYKHAGERGQVYVPHKLVNKLGHPLADVQINKLTEAGFQKARSSANFSVKMLKELASEGHLGRDVETNPYNLLVHTVRQRARKQADMTTLHSIAGTMGTATRVVDEAKLAKVLRGTSTLKGKIAEKELAHAAALSSAHTKEQLFLAEHEMEHAHKLNPLLDLFNKHKYGLKVGLRFDDVIKAQDGDLRHILVKNEEGKLAGRITYRQYEPGKWFVQNVQTDPAFQRQGIASALFHRANEDVGGVLEHSDLKSEAGESFAKAMKPLGKTGAANAARAAKRINAVQAAHAATTKDIAAGNHAGLNEIVNHDVAEAAAHAKDISNMQAELKRLGQVEGRVRVGKRNKAYSPAQMKTIAGAVDAHGHPLAFKPEVAHAVENYQKIVVGNDKAINDFSRGWSKWVANWKLLVTSVNPGYRIRNSMSDVWGMYISGVPMSQVVHYGVKARKLMAAAKHGDPQAIETIKEAYHHGILSGLYQGDIQAVGKMIARRGHSKVAMVQDHEYLKAAGKLSQDVNAHIENLGRMTHYLYRRNGLKESAADAAFTVKKAHFDYEDLTPFEQKVMKNVAPFYTWTRKNIPFQIKALAEHPGRVATFPKAAIESEYASGGDKGNIIPSYVTSGFGFQIPFGDHNYYLPQIGVADLQALDSKEGLKSRTLGLLNPAFKLPLELMMNKSTFSGQPIAGPHPRNPVSNLGADLLKFIPGSNVGETSRMGPGGKQLSGPGANPYYQYMLQQVPWLNEALVKGQGSLKRGQTPIPPELSQVLGQAVQHVDPQLQQQIAEIQLQQDAQNQMKGLRDEGLVPRTKRKKSKKQDILNQVLMQNAGRR